MIDNTNTDGETAAAFSFPDLKEKYANVKLRESTIKDLKTGLKDVKDSCSATLTTLLKYLERSYGNGATLSAEELMNTARRTRDLYQDKKAADDALKALLDKIEDEKTKMAQDMFIMSLGESALKSAAVVSVSKLSEVEYISQRKLKCRRIELVTNNEPGEVVAIREFCGSHSLEIHDAEQ